MSKNKEMSGEECLEYTKKIKEQNRVRQQRFIERKKANGEYEEYNEARTEYKKKYRNKKKEYNKEEVKEEYNLKTLKELKEIVKSKGVKNISKMNKNDLIEMLIKI